PPDFAYLAAGETKTFPQTWYPLHDTGPVQYADRRLAISVRDTGRVTVCAAETLTGVTITVGAGGSVLARQNADLRPGDTSVVDVDCPPDVRLTVRVLRGDEILAEYRQGEPSVPDAAPVTHQAVAPPLPADVATVDELIHIAVYLDQYRHATRSSTGYLDEVLRRDPGESRALLLLGAKAYDRADYATAVDLLVASVAARTRWAPTPASGEAHYRLGLALVRLHRDGEAATALARASWDAPFAVSARFALARLRCRHGDLVRAEALLSEALDIDPRHRQSADLLSTIRGEDTGLPPTADATTMLDFALEFAAAGFTDQAGQALDRAETLAAGSPIGQVNTLPLIKVHRAVLTGRDQDISDCRYAHPSRLDDVDALRTVTELFPQTAAPWAMLGHWYYAHDRPADAIDAWRHALAAEPTAIVHRNLGLAAYNVTGDNNAAVEHYDAALTLAPGDARLWYERDQLAARLGENPAERLARLEPRGHLVTTRDDLTVVLVNLLLDDGRLTEAYQILVERSFQPWEGGEGQVLAAWDRATAMLGVDAPPPANLGEDRHPVADSDPSDEFFATSRPDLLLFEDRPQTVDLAGTWRVTLDCDDSEQPAELPGSLQEQGIGDPVTVDTPWTGLVVDRAFYTDPRYAPYREPGEVAVPFWLQPHTYYRGAATFRRTVDIPAHWHDRPVVLHLERVHWESAVLVDGRRIGSDRSLSTPHRYDLGVLSPGEHTLMIVVDNRTVVDVGPNAHSVSDHTQGNWNGVIGDLRLEAQPAVVIRAVTVTPDVTARSARVRIDLASGTRGIGRGTVTVSARRFNVPGEHVTAPVTAVFDDGREADLAARGMTAGGGHVDLTLDLGEQAQTWDEFHPALYELTTTIGATIHRTVFGLREVGTDGTRITVNGRPVFLRGTLESCVFPLTGHPPTDVASWRRILHVARAHGLNLLRFHSWCPPRAAFRAADEEGFYLQVEGPFWANQGAAVGEGRPIDDFLYAETARILGEFGNHPSFLMMAHGNEPAGRDAEFLGTWVTHWRRRDPRRLYTSAAGWPVIDENDFDNIPDPRLHQWGDGLESRLNTRRPDTVTDYSGIVAAGPRPIVSHEIGQWCAYPDFAETAKYTGLMQPKNFGIFADLLRDSGMAGQAAEFLHASGRLQSLVYKEEVEAALRTPGFGGFHLLGLSDFPGQGTALVGVVDPFWDEKAYSSATAWARFCGPTVPLARLPRRVWRTGEALEFDVRIAHFGPEPLDTAVTWQLGDLAGGVAGQAVVPVGEHWTSGTVVVPAGTVPDTGKVRLTVRAGDFENDWDLWFFTPPAAPSEDTGIVTTADVDEALRYAYDGRPVLLIPDLDLVRADAVLGFTPVFWNTAWTGNQAPHTLGITHDPRHPVFAGFPSDGHTDWQWWDLLHGAKAMTLDGLPAGLRPIVQPIDTWFTARRLGALIEARVGTGRLLICTLNVAGHADSPVPARFRSALLDYMSGASFTPGIELTAEEVRGLFH
ncbi:MAG TPA: tetratricopeptide repeat protein, partial [Actinoplanes sp.]|nr:tetratricopeptide repeat protein [Actinoplanes sp.]